MKDENRTIDHFSQDQINQEVNSRLKRYEGLSFFEQYAMYMGVSQLFELGLKKLLYHKFDCSIKKLERLTLGAVKEKLVTFKIRKDFIALLEVVVKQRNYIAHSLLLENVLFAESGVMKSTIFIRTLQKSIFELERLYFLMEVADENDAW